VIGPRWLSWLIHRKRWERLDRLMTARVKAVTLTTRWQDNAATATGEELYYSNYLAALGEQVGHDAQDAWRAVYGGRMDAASEHTRRLEKRTRTMEAVANEMVAAGHAHKVAA
jgi:hypothetical protein